LDQGSGRSARWQSPTAYLSFVRIIFQLSATFYQNNHNVVPSAMPLRHIA
jgi:hypothetical protein